MMKRVLESELMDEKAQVEAYALADFEQENQGFVDLFREKFPLFREGHILDVGCGPGDIPIRLVRALPHCRVTGIDGASRMIDYAQQAVQDAGLEQAIHFQCVNIHDLKLDVPVDCCISNSLVHHLPNPLKFWYGLKQWVKPGGEVLVMDLFRPDSREEAQAIVDRYASNESSILQRDFYNSLLAAFTDDEIASQLAELNLSRLSIDMVDDRHWLVSGRVY